MRIRTLRLHRDLAAFVFEQMSGASKQDRGIMRTAVERATTAAEMASELRTKLGADYATDPSMLAAMRDLREAFKAANLPVGGKQQVIDTAHTLAKHLGVDVPAFALPPAPKAPKAPKADKPAQESKPSKDAAPTSTQSKQTGKRESKLVLVKRVPDAPSDVVHDAAPDAVHDAPTPGTSTPVPVATGTLV